MSNASSNPIDLLGNCRDDRLLEAIRIVDQDLNTDVIISPRVFSEYVDRSRTFMADRKLHTYTVPMIKPLRIALDIWKKYKINFLD